MIHWIFTQNKSQDIHCLLDENAAWFSGDELIELGRIAIQKRSMEWLFSRLTIKKLVSEILGDIHPRRLRVRKESSGVPYVEVDGQGRTGWLSLSHSTSGVLAAFSPDPDCRFGVDLESLEPRSPGLLEDFFTPSERAWVAGFSPEGQTLSANLIWSAKEAYLKAIGMGLRLDTRRIEIQACEMAEKDDWNDLNYTTDGAADPAFRMLYRTESGYILTLCLPSGAGLHRVVIKGSSHLIESPV